MIHTKDVRRKVEGTLRRKVSEFHWQLLVKDHYLDEYEQTGDLQLLIDRIRDLEKIEEESRGTHRETKDTTERIVEPDERLVYLARIWAVEAAELPEVVRFREKYLGGTLLRFEDMEEWIEATRKADGPGSLWFTLALRAEYIVREEGRLPRLRDLLEALSNLPPDMLDQFVLRTPGETLDYAVPQDEWVRRVPIQHDGVLYRLKQLAQSLERRYGWTEAAAVVFVLTGITPWIPKATVTTQGVYHSPTQRITLKVDPRMSADEVREVYAEARSSVFKGRDRPMSKKHLELALFLVKNPRHTWREMASIWNKEKPEWAYSSWQNFARDARSAYQRITGKRWIHQGPKENKEES